MKLTIIGCTGSFPGPSSPASCYLVTAFDGTRDWKILLDLGSGALGVLQRYTDIKDLDGIMISHLHPDHCMDLCGMHVAIRWDPNGWNRERCWYTVLLIPRIASRPLMGCPRATPCTKITTLSTGHR